ncbi:hypothetical protein N9W41_00565 [bacterium]|nr:hypothetical protein [bacterium]
MSSPAVKKIDLILDTDTYFTECLDEAFQSRKIEANPNTSNYLVNLLKHYMSADNLYVIDSSGKRKQETPAEMLLKALNQDSKGPKVQLLKKLGDTCLYVGGFFGDSLNKRIVDLDYYIEMGETAYGTLATNAQDQASSQVYEEFSYRFTDFLDVLTHISLKLMVQTNEDLLKLYDKYITTGSELAKDQLVEKGILNAQLKNGGYQ